MNRERHQQVKRLFLAAAELDPGRVEAYLDQECSNDSELRAEVEVERATEVARVDW